MSKFVLFALIASTLLQFCLAASGPWICSSQSCRRLPDISGRKCMCLKDVSTYKIYCDPSLDCGSIKAFASTDCTGAYDSVTGSGIKDAYWVNSISFGGSGSSTMYGTCSTFDGYIY
ncbi:hypothetical protein BC940DRAFT_291831 [Gongronella butleri]|nr:hypothetical protein BC940DRAFT_291831 [Gongronella butleri]